MGPRLDLIVQSISRTRGGLGLAMPKERVVILKVSSLLGQLNQILGILQHLSGGSSTLKVANKDNANALAVVIRSMGTLQTKATTLVHLSVAGYYEVIANIAEVPASLVIRLNVLDHSLALIGGGASVGIIRVMDDHIVHGSGYPGRRTSSHRSPAAAGFDLQGIRGES